MKPQIELKSAAFFPSRALKGLGIWILWALAGVSFASGEKPWGTFGGSPKMDVPNLARVDLSVEVPPEPEKYTWTVVARKNANSGTSAIGHIENVSSGFLTPKEVAFGTVIIPLRIKAFKQNMHYQFESSGKERIWIDGVFLKIEAK